MQNTLVKPADIVRSLLEDEAHEQVAQRTAVALARRANGLIDRAASAGLQIEYLGISPLFEEPRLYRGPATDWVLGPATRMGDLVVPRAERERLGRLVAAGVDVPALFIAHEVSKERTKGHAHVPSPVVLDPATADQIIGPPPVAASSVAAAERLAERSHRALKTLGSVALAAAVAPAVLVAGAVASLATLDPIILGAVPLTTVRPGAPAAWLALAKWEW